MYNNDYDLIMITIIWLSAMIIWLCIQLVSYVAIYCWYLIVLFIVKVLMADNRPKSLEAIRTSEESKHVDTSKVKQFR